MRYDTIQSAVTTQLQNAISGAFGVGSVEVVPMPDTEAEYRKPFVKPRLTVIFTGAKFGTRTGPDPVRQLETVALQVNIQAKRLYTNEGIYPLVEATRLALLGFRPEDCQPMTLVEVSPVSHDIGTYEYVLLFEATRPAHQFHGPPDASLIKQLIFTNPISNQQTIVP